MTDRTSSLRGHVLPIGLWMIVMGFTPTPSWGLTLVYTDAGIVECDHPQIEADGGASSHLLQVLTAPGDIDMAIDADVLIADGTWLVTRWRRDCGDADVVELSLALALDGDPSGLKVVLRPCDGPTPVFDSIGSFAPSGDLVAFNPSSALIVFESTIGPLDDVLLGDPSTGDGSDPPEAQPWRIDLSALTAGEEFELVLRAGPFKNRPPLLPTPPTPEPISKSRPGCGQPSPEHRPSQSAENRSCKRETQKLESAVVYAVSPASKLWPCWAACCACPRSF